MQPEDVLILLKLSALKSRDWCPSTLTYELGHTPSEIEASLKRIRGIHLLNHDNGLNPVTLRRFILMDVPRLWPVKPGKLTLGLLTGAKPNQYFAHGLPYSSIWVWPKEDGQDKGYEIKPLSPHCCFAALNDSKLRQLMAIMETLRVSGHEAREWAEKSFSLHGLF